VGVESGVSLDDDVGGEGGDVDPPGCVTPDGADGGEYFEPQEAIA
jgi:hypothetical protein